MDRAPTLAKLSIKAQNLCTRLAFSHLSIHRLLISLGPIIAESFTPSNAGTVTAGDRNRSSGRQRARDASDDGDKCTHSASAHSPSQRSGPSRTAVVAAKAPFRRRIYEVELAVLEAGVWLCNDQEASYGAPDVLQVCAPVFTHTCCM